MRRRALGLALLLPACVPEHSPEFEMGGVNLVQSEAQRLALVPSVALIGSVSDELHLAADIAAEAGLLWDAPAEWYWQIEVGGAPPDSHLGSIDGTGTLALEVPVLYADRDGSGALGPGDRALAVPCVDGARVFAAWLPDDPDVETRALMELYGLPSGWTAAAIAPDGTVTVLEPDELTTLRIEASCTL